jgi:hypothetical protein
MTARETTGSRSATKVAPPPPIITLTTDFGLGDPFVAAMKGVILTICPRARIEDISHAVPPRDIRTGALVLDAAAPLFPDGAIHVAVVDPGVGGARAAVAVQTLRHVYVGPDNGLFTLVAQRESVLRAVRLDNTALHRVPVCPTFHGRDIFAPVAAHLAKGKLFQDLGSRYQGLCALDLPHPVRGDQGWELHVLYTDRFGNVVLDLTREEEAAWQEQHPWQTPVLRLRPGVVVRGIKRTYADVPPGQLVAYMGSHDRLEVGVRDGSAQELTGLDVGSVVHLVGA